MIYLLASVLIDRSGSMGESVTQASKVSRWDAVKEYALTVARECEKLDDDGMLLITTANKLESDGELGISFIQIGNDKPAAVFLKKLDDELVSAGAKFDIVDTKTCDDLDNMSVQDMLLAAVND